MLGCCRAPRDRVEVLVRCRAALDRVEGLVRCRAPLDRVEVGGEGWRRCGGGDEGCGSEGEVVQADTDVCGEYGGVRASEVQGGLA